MRVFCKKNYLIIIILLIAAFFHFYKLGVPVFYTDESELFLSSQRIFDSGVPRGSYLGMPFYENAYIHEINDTMYEFKPTNFQNTDLVIKKGWFTYYLTAFTSLFGDSEGLLRFPFALIGLISLFFFYKLTKLMFNRRVALIAALLYAISPSLLYYDRMLRYYSPMFLFIILTVYFVIKAIKEDKKYYLYASISAILLFHTNILICLSLCLVIAIYSIIKRINLRDTIKGIIIFLAGTIPWLLGTGFIWNLGIEPKPSGFDPSRVYNMIVGGINSQGTLYIVFYLAIALLLVNLLFLLFNKNIKNKNLQLSKENTIFLSLYIVIMIVVPSLLVSHTSFNERLFASLVPFFLIICALFFDSIIKILEEKNISINTNKRTKTRLTKIKTIIAKTKTKTKKSNHVIHICLIIIFIILLSLVHINTKIGEKGHNILDLKTIILLERDNTFKDIKNEFNNYIDKETLVLSSASAFNLMYYLDYPVQRAWPIRKDFIDSFEGDLIIIVDNNSFGECDYFNQFVNASSRCYQNVNYYDRIKSCEKKIITENVSLYYCKAKRKFHGDNLGLFFADFPKAYPPDFIWDQVSFPVAVNISNLGETDVESLKIFFANDFASKEFDRPQEIYEYKDIIKSQKYNVNGLKSYSVFVNLGDLTLNHKLLQKDRPIKAGVSLCYPYTTKLRLVPCDGYETICSYETSGAPIQIKDFILNQTTLTNKSIISFKFNNLGEGKVVSFDNCKDSNEYVVNSEHFKCKFFYDEMRCESNNLNFDEDIITINYAYRQDFTKTILLRSKEKNKYDYENFYQEK